MEDHVVFIGPFNHGIEVNYILVIAIQKILDDAVNVLEEMSEAAATFTKPVLLVDEYAVKLKVANKFILITRSNIFMRWEVSEMGR